MYHTNTGPKARNPNGHSEEVMDPGTSLAAKPMPKTTAGFHFLLELLSITK